MTITRAPTEPFEASATGAGGSLGERRGVVGIAQWEVRTRYPFGWFRAWTYVQAPLRILVAPAPSGGRDAPGDRSGRTS